MGEFGGFGFVDFSFSGGVLISGFLFLVGGGGGLWELGDDWCGGLCSSEFI